MHPKHRDCLDLQDPWRLEQVVSPYDAAYLVAENNMDETIRASPALTSMIIAARKYMAVSGADESPFTNNAMSNAIIDQDAEVEQVLGPLSEQICAIEKMNKAVGLLYHIIAVLDNKVNPDLELPQLESNGSTDPHILEMKGMISKLKMIDGPKRLGPALPKKLRNFEQALKSIYNVTTRLKLCLDEMLVSGFKVNNSPLKLPQ